MAPAAASEIVGNKKERLPGWLQRAIAPLKPALRPIARGLGLSRRLSVELETVLLVQIEDFKPDVILNQDVFYVSTKLMRRILNLRRSRCARRAC
ncbi:hypothetical protein [Bradyrhizobium manausense]|uniref:Uncharacterized protein n=1 Tax=Bradyrhizobium manausense TaxID=989370 RepID=A0A0R3DKD7_9BRAD|nr:hypothetical protein [Bradyrhizobium manausense]KRQ10129.1 hypothetical protein AOQ71_19340 [Bradyrhizobium manausense]